MIGDSNAMKDPIARADRLDLALRAMQQSVLEAGMLASSTGDGEYLEAANRALIDFEPQYLELTTSLLEEYHTSRIATLRRSKSGSRQLVTSRATLKQLSRLKDRYTEDPLRELYDRIWNFWNDQTALLTKYDAE
jgi:hypothetical protein